MRTAKHTAKALATPQPAKNKPAKLTLEQKNRRLKDANTLLRKELAALKEKNSMTRDAELEAERQRLMKAAPEAPSEKKYPMTPEEYDAYLIARYPGSSPAMREFATTVHQLRVAMESIEAPIGARSKEAADPQAPEAPSSPIKEDTPEPPVDPKQRPLYMCNSSDEGPTPITFERLHSAQDELANVMEGCLSLVRDLEDTNAHVEFCGPLVMLRVTLEYGLSQILAISTDEVMPEVAQ